MKRIKTIAAVAAALAAKGPLNEDLHRVLRTGFGLKDSEQDQAFVLKYGPRIGSPCWTKDVVLPRDLAGCVLVTLQKDYRGTPALRVKAVTDDSPHSFGLLYRPENTVWKRPADYKQRIAAEEEWSTIMEGFTRRELPESRVLMVAWRDKWKKKFPNLKLGSD